MLFRNGMPAWHHQQVWSSEMSHNHDIISRYGPVEMQPELFWLLILIGEVSQPFVKVKCAFYKFHVTMTLPVGMAYLKTLFEFSCALSYREKVHLYHISAKLGFQKCHPIMTSSAGMV